MHESDKKRIGDAAMSAKIMTIECGLCFHANYINGGNYVRILYTDHNFDRCQTQFKLVADMESKWDEMVDIV